MFIFKFPKLDCMPESYSSSSLCYDKYNTVRNLEKREKKEKKEKSERLNKTINQFGKIVF